MEASTPSVQDQSTPAATKTDNDQPIKHHVFFVVHGMGQRRQKFLQNMESLTMISEEVKSSPNIRCHFIPIEWHTKLHNLPSVDKRMSAITMGTVKILREICNDYLADTIYYFTEYHGKKIVDLIVSDINEHFHQLSQQYDRENIITWNLLGHSLGGVICYDILHHNMKGTKDFPMLDIVPNNLFTMGSPIGAVMVMRGTDPATYNIPDTIHLYNIYNPYDPLAYRYEPLIYDMKDSSLKDPVIVDRFAGQTSPSIFSISSFWSFGVSTSPTRERMDPAIGHVHKRKRTEMEVEDAEIDVSQGNQPLVSGILSSLRNRISGQWLLGFMTFTNFTESVSDIEFSSEVIPAAPPEVAPSSESLEKVGERYDYQLQVNFIQNINNEYINGISAHFSYWTSVDFVNFLLSRVSLN